MDAWQRILGQARQTAEYQRLSAVPGGWDWTGFQAERNRVDYVIYLLNEVLWPTFVEVKGLVVRKKSSVSEGDLSRAIQSYGDLGAPQKEFLINHLHVNTLFIHDPEANKYDPSVWVYLGRIIAEMWRKRLEGLFPDLQFEVGVMYPEQDPQVYAITLR